MRLVFFLLLFPLSVLAQGTSIETQRDDFRALLNAAEKGNLGNHPQTRDSLASYPLYEYLTAADLRWQLRRTPGPALDRKVEQFIAANPDLPPAKALRSYWAFSLARRGHWAQVKSLTADSSRTSEQCLNVRAKIALTETSSAQKDAIALWLVGKSQPDACDPVFAWMKKRGLLTQARILERARLAASERDIGLTKYLARKLNGPAQEKAQRWAALLKNPADLKFASSLDDDVAVAVFKRLARQGVDAAADAQINVAKRLNLGPDAVYEMRRYVALYYGQNHRPEALAWFERLDESRMDDYVRGWRLRAALLQGRWPLVLYWIDRLPPEQAKDETWRYWRARALRETGREDEAVAAFGALAQERSYHGYLAADQIDASYSFNSRPITSNPAKLAQLRANPATARARELYIMDMTVPANREWAVVTKNLDAPGLREAALMAHQWGWHFQSILTLAKSDYWDDLDIRYPLLYTDLVRTYSKQNALDPAYVLAIIRTESLFQPAVHSPAKAVGLMQLLPATARQVAKEIGAPRPSIRDLEEPENNVPLGTGYLREQLDRFDNNLALASAAYNAGPHRVSRWLKEVDHDVAADVWVENIPYNETRHYVERAMSHMTVFQARLGRDMTRVTGRITPITPDSETGK